MTRKISFAVAALLFAGAQAGYTPNKNIGFKTDLDCTSCIRGGYNFCLTIGPGGPNNNGTISSWNCQQEDKTPQWYIDKTNPGVPSGYLCSRGMTDQMNAILNGCRPGFNQNANDHCGAYWIDLSENSGFSVGRSILNFTVGTSCTYRAYTTCGYPEAKWRVNDQTLQEDFDVAFATIDGISAADDMNGWVPNLTTDFNGSYSTNQTLEYTHISQATQSNTLRIPDDQWSTCKGITRNLWVTITRVKDSSKKVNADE